MHAQENVSVPTHVVDLSGQHLIRFPINVLENESLEKLILNETLLPAIPEGIGVLKELKVLEFNHLEKPNLEFKRLPEAIAQLHSLESIGLIGLPNLDWDHAITLLQQLPKLNNLAAMQNNFKTLPQGIEGLAALRMIWLGGNTELDPAEVFDRLPQIEQVGFGGSQYTQLPTNVYKATELNNLWLANNELTSMEALSSNYKLRSIALNSNKLTQLPIGLTALPLERLSLDNNPTLNWEQTIGALATMKTLQQLTLNNNGLTRLPDNLVQLVQLKTLSLRNNYFDEKTKETIRTKLPHTKVIF